MEQVYIFGFGDKKSRPLEPGRLFLSWGFPHKAVQTHATARQESVNAFAGRAISEAIERDNAAPAASEGRTEGESNAGE